MLHHLPPLVTEIASCLTVISSYMGLHSPGHRKFSCTQCNETFAWKSSLNRHVEKKHGEEKPMFPCQFCENHYTLASILSDHVKRDHFAERSHQCDICPKSFFKLNDLKYHKRVHLAVKPYVCSTCGKRFSHKSHFYRHERIHTGARPYPCDVCQKTFNQSGALKSHMKTHSIICFISTMFHEMSFYITSLSN